MDGVILNAPGLDAFVGKWIGDICPVGYDDDAFNHCAHFVSHVLKLNDDTGLGPTCATTSLERKQKYKGKGVGACLRVNEIFNACDDLVLPDAKGCLVFITKLTNIKNDGTMGDNPRKHIGIYFGGNVWHYSNTHQEVARWDFDQWKKTLDAHYGGHTTVKFTRLPTGASFLSPAQIQALAR